MSPARTEGVTGRMGFSEVVMEAFADEELVSNFERLYGVRISNWTPPKNGLDALIDEATGNRPVIDPDGARAFIRFVYDFVWTRLPPECFAVRERTP